MRKEQIYVDLLRIDENRIPHVTEVSRKVQKAILEVSQKLFFHKLKVILRLIDGIVGGIEMCDNSKEIDADL